MTEKHHRSAVSLKQTAGEFIIRRLKEAGISHMFGVPGDYNLEFLEQVEADKELVWVGCCNELNASYAADGYARTTGLSALMTTYGVGELSALCGIAGAYAEHIPVVAISGAPPLTEIERNAFLHHSAADGDFNNMMICAQQFSVAHARLTPQNVVAEIDRCLRACILQKRPVYLQLPSDICCITINVPSDPFSCGFQSDCLLLDAFIERVTTKLHSAISIVLLIEAVTTIFRDRAPSLCEPSRGSWHRQRDGDFVNAWSSHRPLVITSGQQVRAMVGRRDDHLMLTVAKPW